jgi:hypothetical protein
MFQPKKSSSGKWTSVFVKETFALQRCSVTMFVRDLLEEYIMPIYVPFMYVGIINSNL